MDDFRRGISGMAGKKKAKKSILKKKTGRPSKKDSINLRSLAVLASFGLTDVQLAQAFNITEKTLNNYKKDPEFLQSLKQGKEISDAKVERSLFERATGYEHEDVDIRVVDHKIIKTPLIKHYPPDTAAAIFWLKNRKSDEWKDKHEIGSDDGGPIILKVVYDEKTNPKNGA